MMFSLEGKTALITGASGGIGSALAEAFASAGASVALNGTRREVLEEVAARITADGGKCVVLPASLDSVGACQKLVADTVESLGGLDILIPCAGINRRKRIENVTEDDFDTIMLVNLKSVYFLCQAAHTIMKAAGGGKILTIGSMTNFRGMGMLSVYGMTNAATGLVTQTMAVEWARDNVQVNCLAPGFIETPLTAAGIFGDPVRREWVLSRVPARRPGYPGDLTGAALFLCSDGANFVTGQTLAVDGGFLTGGSWEQD